MKLQRLSADIHKYLSLILGIQIVFWMVSGLFFSLFKIEDVRSEHRMKTIEAAPISADTKLMVQTILEDQSRPFEKFVVESRPEGPRVLITYSDHETQMEALYDANSGQRLSPIDAQMAQSIAQAHLKTPLPVKRTQLVTQGSTEYSGPLPAWRIDFEDRDHLSLYVTQNTAEIKARRSDLWRTYDALWALHIMDWRDHENFNNGLLIFTSLMSLISIVFGLMLLPYRIHFKSWWQRVRTRLDDFMRSKN